MASPQTENGFTPIANEILEKLCELRLSGYEWQVLMVLFRKTYGWQKPHDRISLSQFGAMTKIKPSHVSRTLNKLLKKRIITQIGNTIPQIYSFQKDYDKYLPKQGIPQIGNRELPKQVIHLLPKQVTTKETIQKKYKDRTPPSSPPKTQHLDCVYLSQDEFSKLEKQFGADGARERIEELNLGIMTHGYKYKSCYHAILTWDRRKKKEQTPSPKRAPGLTPEEYKKILDNQI